MAKLSAVLLAAAVAAACGQSGSKEAPASGQAADDQETRDVKGCELVTRDEVSAAAGSAAAEGQDSGLSGCRWKTESGAEVSLQVFAGSLWSSGTCAAQKSLVTGQEEEVRGLGDSALWGSSGNLVVCTAKAVLNVDVENTPNSPDQDREAAVKVARAALGRL